MATASFVGDFVRQVARDPCLRARVASTLSRGQAFEDTATLAVAMIDISGYSKMAADLTFLGKMASEVITRSVGAYLNKIIDVIGLFSGDIVKFLGDAVLVVFGPRHSAEAFDLVVLRATACCLVINAKYSTMELDMTLADMSSALLAGDTTESGKYTSGSRRQGQSGKGLAMTLHLHFAIAAGQVSRLIIGDWANRLDYSVFGTCLASLGPILDGTKKGELGITWEAALSLKRVLKDHPLFTRAPAEPNGHILMDARELFALMALVFSEDLNATLSLTDQDIAARYDITWDPLGAAADSGSLGGYEGQQLQDYFAKFVNQSLLKKLESQWQSNAPTFASAQRRKTGHFSGRGTSVVDVPEGQGIDGGFRSVAAVFVSLLFPFELSKIQRVVICYLAALKKFGGVFQQYSVDDKGQTLLAIFGLPPFTHVNNSEQCIKAMKLFMENLRKEFKDPVELAISVATGDLLFTTIGTDFRGEAGLLGEVVIIAARLMSTAKAKRFLVMDDNTYEFVKFSNETTDLGIVKAKGRVNGVHAYGIALTLDKTEEAAEINFGNERERAIISQRFMEWQECGRRVVVLVEAPSGLGKSSLANFLMDKARKACIPTCLTQGTEKEQWSPFYGLQALLLFILSHAPASVEVDAKMSYRHLAPKRSHLLKDAARGSSMTISLRGASIVSSLGSMSRRGGLPESNNKHLSDVLVRLMRKAGVDTGLAPLLGGVLPRLATGDSDRTRSLDGPARNNLLKSVLIKIITAFVESTTAVFIFDDSQWLDSSTLEILTQISRFCPKEWKMMNLTLHIQSVDPNITTAIYMKTGGNPLFLQMTLEVVIAKIGSDLKVTNDGQLQMTLLDASADAILSDLSAAVLFQFDRLNPIFQRMLKAASILGQYFLLTDVLDILELDTSEEAALQLMKESDVYSFLQFPKPHQTSSELDDPPGEIDASPGHSREAGVDAQDEDSVEADNVRIAFRHIGIMNAIYDSLSFEERIGMNTFVAGVLEGLLCDDNQDLVIPSIEFHYSRAGVAEKIILYREMLGCRLIKKYHCFEGIRILESLTQFVAEVDGDENILRQVTSLRRAKWLSHLCVGYCVLDTYPNERICAFDAFELFGGKPWPVKTKEFNRALRREKRAALLLWVRTSGGRWPTRPLKSEGIDREIFELKHMIFAHLTVCMARDKTFSPKDCELLIYKYLVLLLTHSTNTSTLSLCLLRLSYYAQYFSPGLQQTFLRAAKRYGDTDPAHGYSLAYNSTVNNNIVMMTTYMDRYVSHCQGRGDTVTGVLCAYFASGIAYLTGDLEYVERVATPKFLQYPALKENKMVAFTAAQASLQIALCRGRDQAEINLLRDEFEPHGRFIDAIKYALGVTEVFGMWCLAYQSEGDYAAALRVLEAMEQRIDIDAVGVMNSNLLSAAFLCSVLFFDAARSDVPIPQVDSGRTIPRAWDSDEKARMIKVLWLLVIKTNKIKIQVTAYWALQGYKAMALVMQGRIKAAVRLLKAKLGSRKRRVEIEYLRFFLGVFNGFVGKYSSHDVAYRNDARQIFRAMKAPVYLRWVEA